MRKTLFIKGRRTNSGGAPGRAPEAVQGCLWKNSVWLEESSKKLSADAEFDDSSKDSRFFH